MPASDLDQAGAGVGVEHAAQRLESIIVPSVSAASVKEWPEPATLTLRPAAAAPATASRQLLAARRATILAPAGSAGRRPSCATRRRPLAPSAIARA